MTRINFQNNITKANADTFNTMQDNIENGITDAVSEAKDYADELQTYSTTEQVVGTWIDGKTIYRKVFIGICDNTSEQTIENNIDYIDNVVSITGNFVRISDGLTSPIGAYLDGVPSRVMYHGGLGKILLNKESSVWNSNFYYKVIIEYTKAS